ncbi:MAG: LemA family protein [Chloroflexi bacterium]|nr:LemA family protein [Chloroflexota bacterium]
MINDLPTSKTQGVFIGLAELKGTAESDEPIISKLAEVHCVQYNWQIDEHWSKVVHETYTDSKGHVQTRTRTETGWTKIAGDKKSIPFYLKDDTGLIRIVPEGATIQNITVFNETCSPNNSLYFGKGPSNEISNTTHQRRFHETALPIHTMLYIVGQARERQDIVAPEIAADKNAQMFVISVHTEKQLSSRYGLWWILLLILGLAFAVGCAGTGGFLINSASTLFWQPYIIAACVFLIICILGWIWTVYNSLINLHHRVEQGWSQVDIQLKRRYDLIQNLVKTVEAYGIHEKETQILITELRGQEKATPPGVAGPDYQGVAIKLLAITERYHELKAGDAFLGIQKALVDTEQRIALARDYYNNIATFYNTRLDIIPDRFIAALARIHPQVLMGAADFERAPVIVNLVS